MALNAKLAAAATAMYGPDNEITRAYDRHKSRKQTYAQTYMQLPLPEKRSLPAPNSHEPSSKVIMVKRGAWVKSWQNMVKLAAAEALLNDMIDDPAIDFNTAAVIHRVVCGRNLALRKIVQKGLVARTDQMALIVKETLRKYKIYNITTKDLKSDRRNRYANMVRRECMFRCVEETDFSLVVIGRFFGNRDHTTVLHAHRKYRMFQYSLLGYFPMTDHEWLTADKDLMLPMPDDEICLKEIANLKNWKR